MLLCSLHALGHLDFSVVYEINDDKWNLRDVGEALIVVAAASNSYMQSVELGTDYGGLNMGRLQGCDNDKGFGSVVV
ncbi:hypothetical protein PIB30_100575 [Stylosanthes scabra]|uniref:Uncharacterized protein n=1 Tax=Stylosanthes scabra TaxID=79078 RepID=A0ABU6VXK2_9FABA|nr:hypothetical protein [Stylosanthes scabra]